VSLAHVCTLSHCSKYLGFILQRFHSNGMLALSATRRVTGQSAVVFFAHVCVGSEFFQVFGMCWGRAPWCSKIKWNYCSTTRGYVCVCVCTEHWQNNMAWEHCSTHKMLAPLPLCPPLIPHGLTFMIWNCQLTTGTRRIATFRKRTDRTYDSGPMRSQYYYII
jgi:hypothetical protein